MGCEGIKEKKALVIAVISDFLVVFESGKKKCFFCGRSVCETNLQSFFRGDFDAYGVDSVFGSGMQCFVVAGSSAFFRDSFCVTYD